MNAANSNSTDEKCIFDELDSTTLGDSDGTDSRPTHSIIPNEIVGRNNDRKQIAKRKGYISIQEQEYDGIDDSVTAVTTNNIDYENEGVFRTCHQKNQIITNDDRNNNSNDSNNYNSKNDTRETIAGVIGNVLEWYDFAVFGYLSDILGEVFFPPNQSGNKATMESFMVFGGAFLMRPLGGIIMGYIGDTYGSKKALITSIFLMAFPTFAMGCLPSYRQVGTIAMILLVTVRLLQGLSVGGQLMSSLVFTLENHPKEQWGLYGSFVMAAANCGTLLGGTIGFILRKLLSHEQLVGWGWRIPFLAGICVSIAGCYLQSHNNDNEHDGIHPRHNNNNHHHRDIDNDHHHTGDIVSIVTENSTDNNSRLDEKQYIEVIATVRRRNPFLQAIEPQNLRSLLAASMVPMLWASGFYMSFVWMAIYMTDFIDNPVQNSFGINSAALLVSVCFFFPIAGMISDRYGRIRIMTLGGVGIGLFGFPMIVIIHKGYTVPAFFAQCVLGIFLSLWGGPMCSWLVESFHPEARLTSVSIGYNVAHAIAGGSTPAVATWLVDTVNPIAPGIIFMVVSSISLIGLLFVAPSSSTFPSLRSDRTLNTNMEIEMTLSNNTNADEYDDCYESKANNNNNNNNSIDSDIKTLTAIQFRPDSMDGSDEEDILL